MQLASERGFVQGQMMPWLKSFFMWSFALLVSMLVVGFPILVVVMTAGALAAVVLQAVMPMSAVVLVAGVILAFYLLGTFAAAAILTMKGIHPQDVKWLDWLQGDPVNEAVYASCPLTCDMER